MKYKKLLQPAVHTTFLYANAGGTSAKPGAGFSRSFAHCGLSAVMDTPRVRAAALRHAGAASGPQRNYCPVRDHVITPAAWLARTRAAGLAQPGGVSEKCRVAGEGRAGSGCGRSHRQGVCYHWSLLRCMRSRTQNTHIHTPTFTYTNLQTNIPPPTHTHVFQILARTPRLKTKTLNIVVVEICRSLEECIGKDPDVLLVTRLQQYGDEDVLARTVRGRARRAPRATRRRTPCEVLRS